MSLRSEPVVVDAVTVINLPMWGELALKETNLRVKVGIKLKKTVLFYKKNSKVLLFIFQNLTKNNIFVTIR